MDSKTKNMKKHVFMATGVIIAPVSSLISHSCNANLMRVFTKRKILHFAKRPIKKEEQVVFLSV